MGSWPPLAALLVISVLGSFALTQAAPASPAPASSSATDGPRTDGGSTPDGPSPGWLSSIKRQISDSEYELTWQTRTDLPDLAEAWHAPNRAHGFRAYFTDDGVRLVPRTGEKLSWEWGLEHVGYGRGGSVWSAAPAVLAPESNRIDYDRGAVVEWYENSPRGLKQGFTLSMPPGEAGSRRGPDVEGAREAGPALSPAATARSASADRGSGAIFLNLSLTGNLSPVISADGQAIDFTAPGGARVLRYAELEVWDARGRTLPAWMEAFSDAGLRGIRLVIDDTDALYPVTVDPLATSPAWTAESDQASAQFGVWVATAGDVDGDGFSDVIVGADLFDNGQADEGMAFVFHGSASGLSAVAGWTAEADQASSQFGFRVATAGDVNGDGYADVIIGAQLYDNGQSDEGAAFVFHGSAAGLTGGPSAGPLDADWTVESNQANTWLGSATATAGDINGDGFSDVIVGAIFLANGENNEGGAFAYHGSATGLSGGPNADLTDADWSAESDQVNARFGRSAATAGDVNGDGFADVIIGAHVYDNGEADEGGAFVYHGSAVGLTGGPDAGLGDADWTAESNQISAQLGKVVGTAGDVNGDGYADVIIGAHLHDNGESGEGRALVYHGSAGGLTGGPNAGPGDADWTAEGDQVDAHLGVFVATAGDVDGDGYADVIVGADLYDNGETDEGSAFLYHGSAAGLSGGPNAGPLDADWTAESDQADAKFGISAATAGDVNGDGFADVIVGADLFDNGEVDEGRAFVYHGSAGGLPGGPSAGPLDADWTAESDQVNAELGFSVASAGDVNGDGFADAIVGAHMYDNGEVDEGRVFVYHGSASGLLGGPNAGPLDADWTAEADQASAQFGFRVATAGDVNGDGFSDVIVGARQYSNGEFFEGGAFVYHGSATGLTGGPNAGAVDADWSVESNLVGVQLGNSVATAGDVNGDGFSDVIVGANLYYDGQGSRGRAFVYHGSPSGLPGGLGASPLDADWTADGEGLAVQSDFGISVATAGDVNGDGFSDVIIGAPLYDYVQLDDGRVFVYHGSATGLSGGPSAGSLDADWAASSNVLFLRTFGISVATAGDVNGDAFSDVIVGASQYSNGENFEGRAFVYHGSATGLTSGPNAFAADADWAVESDQANAELGVSVATAGDVNGDGFADVIIGAWGFDNGEFNEGMAFVFHGSALGLTGGPNANPSDADWTVESDQLQGRLGIAVATVGDVNGDGFADVIIGSQYDNGELNEGVAFVYHGNAGGGLSLTPQQRRAVDTASIAPLGVSDSNDSFRLALLGRTPFGRGLVKLESEIKPLGTPFDGAGTQISSTWMDTDTAGAALNELVTGLSPETVYHWRVRLLYNPVTTPLQPASRWLTVPRNGWQEADLRTPAFADLSVTMMDGADPLFPGDPIVYSLSVSNGGPDSIEASLIDDLPAGVTFVSAVPSQGSCSGDDVRVTCALGTMANGGAASVTVTVTAPTVAGLITNTVTVLPILNDPGGGNNIAIETTDVVARAVGDFVWEDLDGDGVQDPGEPGMANVLVALYDDLGTPLASTFTGISGDYTFPGLTAGNSYLVRYIPPAGFVLTLADQGGDDALDSDADPVTIQTPVFSLTAAAQDALNRDAGMIPFCIAPDEPIFVEGVTLGPGDEAILSFQDFNQPSQITGYHIYRSDSAAPPPNTWPLLASDIVDGDAGTANIQWTDTTGDVSPTGIWYYHVTAYNSRCPAEGPF